MPFPSHRRIRPPNHKQPVSQSLAYATAQVWHQRLMKQRRMLRVACFIIGLFLLPLILPASPVHPTLVAGYGGGTASSAVQHASTLASQPLLVNPIAGLTGLAGNAVSSAFTGALSGLAGSFVQWLHDSFKSIIDAAVGFDFVTRTPHDLTDGHNVVISLEGWMLVVVDGLLSLFLVIGGYTCMFSDYEGFRVLAPRLLVAAIVAHFSLFFLGQFIEANNTLCDSVFVVLSSLGIGKIGLDPVGVFNLAIAPEYLVIVYLLYLLAMIWLIIQMLLRLALLDLLLVLAPLGLLCLALPQTRMWGQMWAQVFVATFITQFLQVLCIAIGAALVGSFGHSSISPISLLVGIAALFLAGRIPDILLFRVVRLNAGTSNAFTEQAGGAIQTGAEMAALLAA